MDFPLSAPLSCASSSAVLGSSSPCQSMAWANCCAKRSVSLLQQSRSSSSGFVVDRGGIGSTRLKAVCNICGIRVCYGIWNCKGPRLEGVGNRAICSYSGFVVDRRSIGSTRLKSGCSLSEIRVCYELLHWKRPGLEGVIDRWGELVFCFGVRNSRGSWSASRARLPSVVQTILSLKKEELDDGLENGSRKQAPTAAKRQVRKLSTVNSKGQQLSHQVEGSTSAAAANRLGSKSKTRVPSSLEAPEGDPGCESPTGRRSAGWKVSISAKESTGNVVLLGSDLPKLNDRSSKDSDYRRSSSSSLIRKAGPSIIVDSEPHLEPVTLAVGSSSMPMNLQQSSNLNQPGPGERKMKVQKEKKLKTKHFPAEAVLRRDLNMCSKYGDVIRALEIYDKSIGDGIVKWNQYNFNVLLYLCSSAALGTMTASKSGTDRAEAERLNLQSADQNLNGDGPGESSNGTTGSNGESGNGHETATTSAIVLSPEVMGLAADRGFEIFEEMRRQGVPPNEATLTAVARLAVRRGDGDLAFQMVKEMAAMNLAPKLRSYSPAIVMYCKSKAVKKAFEVDAHMLAAGVQPEEPELGALLQVCVELGLEKEVYSLLHRLRVKVRDLAPSTVASIEEWFSGVAGASAGKETKQPDNATIQQALEAGGGGWHGLGWLGEGKWKVKWTTINSEGFCCCCKKRLVTIDLDPQETQNFAQSLSDLAFAREAKPNEFKRFQEWLEQRGPFDAIIDGANVGLYNQNFAKGGFNFFQLNSVAKTALDQGLVRKAPLIVLHHARARFGAANSSVAQELIQKWGSSNSLYTTPNGSNDDWYWLYAAVRNKCLLITNDEMRDHIFQLLGNDFFPKWKERHQVRFSTTNRGPQLHLPPPYTLVIQESEDGSWHIPRSGGNDIDTPHEWLCVTRPQLPCNTTAITALVDSGLKATPAENGRLSTQTSQELGVAAETSEIAGFQRPSSPESDETKVSPGRRKRHRGSSPSTTLQKMRAADKDSESGPVTFEI